MSGNRAAAVMTIPPAPVLTSVPVGPVVMNADTAMLLANNPQLAAGAPTANIPVDWSQFTPIEGQRGQPVDWSQFTPIDQAAGNAAAQAGMFSDLIPGAQGGNAKPGMFDDLIPQQPQERGPWDNYKSDPVVTAEDGPWTKYAKQKDGGKWWEAAPLANSDRKEVTDPEVLAAFGGKARQPVTDPEVLAAFGKSPSPAKLVPVDHDPFATPDQQPQLVPVDHDPFAAAPTPPIDAARIAGTINRMFAPDAAPAGNLADVVSGKIDQGRNRVPDLNSPQAQAQAKEFGTAGYYLTPAEAEDARTRSGWEQFVSPPGGWSGAARRVGASLGDQGRALGNMFGLGDRAAAVMEGDGATYNERLAQNQKATADAMQRLGVLGKAQTVIGDSLGAAAVMPQALMGMGATPVARVVGGAGGGFALGAIGGAAQTPAGAPWADMAMNAGKQGGEGAVLGGLAPVIARPVGNLVSAGAQKVADALYWARHGSSLSARVADPILAGLGQQGQTVRDAAGRLGQLGPGSTLADTGAALEGQANRLANRDTAVLPTIENNLAGRLETLDQRIPQAVNRSFGADVNAVEQMQNLRSATATNGQRLYGQAFANPKAVDVSPVLQQIDQQISPGASRMVGSGVKDDPITAALRQARSYIAGNGSQAANIQTLHRAQDVIDDMAASAQRGGNNAQARALWNVRGKLLQQMDDVNPEYAAARQQYASDKAIENAFENGRDILATKQGGQVFDPDLLESRLAQMSQPERDAYQLGARKALSDVMGQARSDPAGLRTRLSNDNGYAVGKLRQVFGDDPVNAMLSELDAQAAMRGTNNTVLGNSATAFRQAADNTIPGFGKEAAKTSSNWHGSLPLSIIAGEETGRRIGSLFHAGDVGSAVGLVAGPLLSAGARRVAAAMADARAAARTGLANTLTSPARQEVIDALIAREASRPGVANAREQARRAFNTLIMQQAGQGVDPSALIAR